MLSSTLLISFITATLTFAAPTPLAEIRRPVGKVNPGSLIVKLKDDVAGVSALSWLESTVAADPHSTITHRFDPTYFNGFAGKFSDTFVRQLRTSPEVEYIEEDAIMHKMATQTNAPWGLARLSSTTRLANNNPAALTFTYNFPNSAGSGVDIYIVDTGINTGHTDFGGRARWGETFGPYQDADGNGHGTHCAGIAAGTRFGVAKSASLIAVKVLSDQGSGTVTDIINGLSFVGQQASASGRPSIASMSLGGGISTALDNATNNLVAQGVVVTVAAGNGNANAANTSPARAANAITVGASDINDARASFSNFGAVVDIFAPGVSVISDFAGSNTATASLSGTSMATPHIAGLVATIIAAEGRQSPAALVSRLHALGLDGVLSGIPAGTNNELAHNNP